MQIRTELDELRPDDAERKHAPRTDQETQPIRPPNTDDSILKHIAEALHQDIAEQA